MGSGKGSGETRAIDAIKSALDSPLLNDNKIINAKNVLLLIVYGEDEITIDEVNEINEYVQRESGNGYKTNIIMGIGEEKNLGKDIEVTIIATGFSLRSLLRLFLFFFNFIFKSYISYACFGIQLFYNWSIFS